MSCGGQGLTGAEMPLEMLEAGEGPVAVLAGERLAGGRRPLFARPLA